MGMIAPSGDAGGQLSDDMEAMGTPVSLERLRAPLAVEDQREAIFFARHALQVSLLGRPPAGPTHAQEGRGFERPLKARTNDDTRNLGGTRLRIAQIWRLMILRLMLVMAFRFPGSWEQIYSIEICVVVKHRMQVWFLKLQVTQNSAYRESNLARRNKPAVTVPSLVSSVDVISLVPGSRITIDSRSVASPSGVMRALGSGFIYTIMLIESIHLLWRNEWIFGEQNVRRESVLLQSQRMQREVVAVISPLKAIAATRHVDQSHPAIVDRRINPPGGWCKLNTDRAVDRVLNLASCGGVIRDE
ncbi:hypothetical protein V6N11_065305 [Hibiscus sabdariffa]|uniref:Uncharacterized protein n=1 Tax=Hibiscus sabdariffa TaxID=183260 RepID=A0ABR2QGL3_9ROSI